MSGNTLGIRVAIRMIPMKVVILSHVILYVVDSGGHGHDA